MKVKVKLFAAVREMAGRGELELAIRDGSTVRDLLLSLVEVFGPSFRDFIGGVDPGSIRPSIRFYIDGKDIESLGGLDTPLREGSVFAIIPPVGGGLEAKAIMLKSQNSPGVKMRTVYAENYGCTANKDDFEIMLAYMEDEGLRFTNSPMEADLILVNTCGVKKQTEDRILGRLKRLGDLGKPLIVAGCLTRINPKGVREYAKDYAAMVDPNSIDRLPEVLSLIAQGRTRMEYYSKGLTPKPQLKRLRSERLIEIVQVSQGCLGNCYFCATKLARGRLKSYPKEMIVEQVRRAVLRGALEIELTSQDMGPYGLDLGYTLADLLEEVLKVEGEFRVRVGMMNPAFAKGIAPRLAELYKDERIYKFIHIPVQSGSDKVLKEMNRDHSVEDFERIAHEFRKAVPDITIATDIIVGYPTETRDDFEETVKLMNRVRPDVTNISRFTPRPGTPAARLEQIPRDVVNERSRILSKICYDISLESNIRIVGKRTNAVALRANEDGTLEGRTHNYKVARLYELDRIGVICEAEVLRAYPRHVDAISVAC